MINIIDKRGMKTTAILSTSLTRCSLLERSSSRLSAGGETTFLVLFLRLSQAVSLVTLTLLELLPTISTQPGLRSSQIVRVGVEHDEDERNNQVEEQPSIDHLDV